MPLIRIVLWGLLQAAAGEDEAVVRRIGDLVEQLGSDDIEVRERAGQELLGLPVRYSARLGEMARKAPEPEVAARLRSFLVPAPWVGALGGTLREARLRRTLLETPEHPKRRDIVEEVLEELAARPVDEVSAALGGLLELPSAGARDFALEAMSRYPPKDLRPVVPMLETPATADRAGAILQRARDPSVVPQVVEIYLRNASPQAGAVLERFGAGEGVDRIVALARRNPKARESALRIISRSGSPRAEHALLQLLQDEKDPQAAEILLQYLALVGGETSIGPVRAYLERQDISRNRSREEVLSALRDPALGEEWLKAARRDPTQVDAERILAIAALTGPRARKEALAWLAQPGLKVGVQKKALLLLGAVGRAEDSGFLLGKLKDPRLLESAAEALDMIGDPAAAAELAEALLRAPRLVEAGRILAALPPDRVTSTIEEILSDPHGYDHLLAAALRLAERTLTPRMREALLKALEDRNGLWAPHRAEALRILAGSALRGDDPAVLRLRGHEKADVRADGLFLAAGKGSREAAAELACLLADQRISAYRLEERFPFQVLPASLWQAALLAEWERRPDWLWGIVELAEAGVPEAQAAARKKMDALGSSGLQERAIRALALSGDAGCLDRIMDRFGRRWKREEEESLAAQATDALKQRLLRKSTSGNLAHSPYFSMLARMAVPEAAPLYLEAVAEGTQVGEEALIRSILALGRLQRRESIPDLRPLLRSTDPSVVSAAMTALAALGDKASIPRIARLVDDPTEVPEIGIEKGRGATGPKRRIWHGAMEALERFAGVAGSGASVAERRVSWRGWYEKYRESVK